MLNSDTYFITGIGTDVGKTFISAILVEGLEAMYWKPIQTGSVSGMDSSWIADILELGNERIVPETWCLEQASSPHSAAEVEGAYISPDSIKMPEVDKPLIIEGAGGVMVPLNDDEDLLIDVIRNLQIPVIVVVKTYLGCINHTLLTLEALAVRNIPIKGMIFNGDEEAAAKSFILNFADIKLLGHIPWIENPDKEKIGECFKKYIVL